MISLEVLPRLPILNRLIVVASHFVTRIDKTYIFQLIFQTIFEITNCL